MQEPQVLGIDIGGSHITVAGVDLVTGRLIPESLQRKTVDSTQEKERIIREWTGVIKKAIAQLGWSEAKIGMAMPGPFDYEEGVAWIKDQDKYRSLYGVNVKNVLAEALNMDPSHIRFINDAAAFMQGEIISGAAKGASQGMGLTLGTGLGSAFFEALKCRDASLWNVPFKEGIAEDYLSTRWFIDRYRQLTGMEVSGVKELTRKEHLHPEALQVFEEFGFNLGTFLQQYVRSSAAEIVILGGNIAKAYRWFSAAMLKVLEAEQIHVKVSLSELNEHASLIGAAGCWSKKIHQEHYAVKSTQEGPHF